MNIKHLFKLKSYERIEMIIRKHPFFLFRDLALFLILAVVPGGVVVMILPLIPNLFTNYLALPIAGIVGSVYYLAIWLFFFSTVLDYYLDIWVVTNDRLIAVDQAGLFSRTISEMDLWLIQDVTSEMHGIAATIFGYGNLHVQTAAEKARFHFENCANPNGIRQKILAFAEEDRKYHVGSVELKKAGL
jgi:hypothetical protein